jgi:hypothetical protein
MRDMFKRYEMPCPVNACIQGRKSAQLNIQNDIIDHHDILQTLRTMARGRWKGVRRPCLQWMIDVLQQIRTRYFSELKVAFKV